MLGLFIFINSALTNVTGLEPEDVLGRQSIDIQRLNPAPDVAKQEQQLILCGGGYSSEEILRDNSGKQKEFVCHSSAVAVNDGEDIAGIVGVFVEKGKLAFSESYEAALQLNPGQKAIVVSGCEDSEELNRTLALGACLLVKKPYTIEELSRGVRVCLGG